MKFSIVVTAIFFLPASSVSAARVFVEPSSREIRPEDRFEVSFFINTQNEQINAIEGAIVYPSDLLVLEEIRDGSSVVMFWIERPREEAGKIPFSGLIPGGLRTENSLIFRAVFRAKKNGQGMIDPSGLRILLNDGEGTEAHSVASGAQILISERVPSAEAVVVEDDTQAPEEFTAVMTRDPSLFEGKYFLVFATQDKGSGIDHYEVCERGETSCVTAESPYVLMHQALRTEMIIRAVDKKGNERVVVLPSGQWFVQYRVALIFGMLLGAVVVSILVRKRNKRDKGV